MPKSASHSAALPNHLKADGLSIKLHHNKTVSIPLEIADVIDAELSRAHMSIHALAKLFRSGTLDDAENALPYLLSYIEQGLETCSENLRPFMRDAA